MTPEFTTGRIRPIDSVKEGWALIKDDYWMLFAVSLVGAMIGGVSMYVLLGPMICGIFICYFKRIDGGKVVFDDLWLGFKYFGRSLLVTILIVVPIVVYIFAVFMTIYLPIILQAIGGSRFTDRDLLGTFFTAVAIDVVIAVVMVSIHSTLMFAFPLIVDRGLSSVEAIKLSARAAFRNMKGVGGLIVVNFVLALAGEMLCGIGLYFAIPLLTMANLIAYRQVFPAPRLPGLEPPPPTAYPELA
ncbi:MAG: hypothetical protein ACJ73D_02825 [Pyrinomonadaceae bacterium]